MKIIFLSFDDAKVRRFLQSAMDYTLFLHKKRISFDVNQLVVCEHTQIVCENGQFQTSNSKSLMDNGVPLGVIIKNLNLTEE